MPSARDVTIIIPSYCTTEESVGWLKEAVASAKAQPCKVIVVDDCSPLRGEVYDVLSEVLGYGDDGAVLEHHRGVSVARNVAASMVRTSLLYPLDGDDLLVPDALNKLTAAWNGKPVYSDLEKFSYTKSVIYPLLDFTCELAYEKIGIASVNVLHSVEQHKHIGGWNESLDFYEDGEYNARLMLCFGAVKYPQPLVRYRQHEHQRTQIYKKQHAIYAEKVFNMIRRYDTMACPGGCGKRKQAVKQQQGARVMSQQKTLAAALPGEDGGGKVLARYVGGAGKGSHYKRGPVSNWPYKVKYGDQLYVDPRDVVDDESQAARSPFIRVHKEQPKTAVKQVVKKDLSKTREPRKDKVKEPIVEEAVESNVLDILTQSQDAVLYDLDEIDPADAAELLENEQRGKNRKKVVNKLKRRIKSSGDEDE